jgi:hypothetical protein
VEKEISPACVRFDARPVIRAVGATIHTKVIENFGSADAIGPVRKPVETSIS